MRKSYSSFCLLPLFILINILGCLNIKYTSRMYVGKHCVGMQPSVIGQLFVSLNQLVGLTCNPFSFVGAGQFVGKQEGNPLRDVSLQDILILKFFWSGGKKSTIISAHDPPCHEHSLKPEPVFQMVLQLSSCFSILCYKKKALNYFYHNVQRQCLKQFVISQTKSWMVLSCQCLQKKIVFAQLKCFSCQH